MWRVYIVRAGNGALYTGIARDVERRLAEHRGGGRRGAKSLRGRGPLRLVFERPIGDRGTALRVERRIQRLSRRAKERLIADDPATERLLELLELDGAEGGHSG